MKKYLTIMAGCLLLTFWPQRQSPAQQPEIKIDMKAHADTISLTGIKDKIADKFDSLQHEINRIATHRKTITRQITHTRRINHYQVDTVMLFIDTCYGRNILYTVRTDTVYPIIKKRNKVGNIFNNIFHKKRRPQQDIMKVILDSL